MSDTYNLFQQGRTHLREGMAAQATVPLEKAKRREPEKASIREALGIAEPNRSAATFKPPAAGTPVWIQFEGGNTSMPVWLGFPLTRR